MPEVDTKSFTITFQTVDLKILQEALEEYAKDHPNKMTPNLTGMIGSFKQMRKAHTDATEKAKKDKGIK